MTYGWYTGTYEWHMDDIRGHTSDIWMIYKYIRVTYGWHTSTYKWHKDDMRVTYGWHAVRKKNKVKIFLKTFWYFSFKISDLWKNSLHSMTVLGYLPKLKRGLELTFGAHFLRGFFHANAPYLIPYQLTKFQRHIFFTRYQTKCVIKFLFRQLMTS